MIIDFLGKKISSNWDSMDLMQRRQFWNGNLVLPADVVLIEREKVCAMEIGVECFNGDMRYIQRRDSVKINNILQGIRGWQRHKAMGRYDP